MLKPQNSSFALIFFALSVLSAFHPFIPAARSAGFLKLVPLSGGIPACEDAVNPTDSKKELEILASSRETVGSKKPFSPVSEIEKLLNLARQTSVKENQRLALALAGQVIHVAYQRKPNLLFENSPLPKMLAFWSETLVPTSTLVHRPSLVEIQNQFNTVLDDIGQADNLKVKIVNQIQFAEEIRLLALNSIEKYKSLLNLLMTGNIGSRLIRFNLLERLGLSTDIKHLEYRALPPEKRLLNIQDAELIGEKLRRVASNPSTSEALQIEALRKLSDLIVNHSVLLGTEFKEAEGAEILHSTSESLRSSLAALAERTAVGVQLAEEVKFAMEALFKSHDSYAILEMAFSPLADRALSIRALTQFAEAVEKGIENPPDVSSSEVYLFKQEIQRYLSHFERIHSLLNSAHPRVEYLIAQAEEDGDQLLHRKLTSIQNKIERNLNLARGHIQNAKNEIQALVDAESGE